MNVNPRPPLSPCVSPAQVRLGEGFLQWGVTLTLSEEGLGRLEDVVRLVFAAVKVGRALGAGGGRGAGREGGEPFMRPVCMELRTGEGGRERGRTGDIQLCFDCELHIACGRAPAIHCTLRRVSCWMIAHDAVTEYISTPDDLGVGDSREPGVLLDESAGVTHVP